MTGLVVGGNGDIDISERRIGVTEGDNRDVDIRGFANGLVIDSGVGYYDETGLLKRTSNVVGEGTGGKTARNCLSTSVRGVFQYGSVAIRSSRDNTNVVGVFDGGNDTGSKDQLLPGLANIEDVDACNVNTEFNTCNDRYLCILLTIGPSLPNIRLHLFITVFCADMALCGQQELDLLVGSAEDGGKF